MCKFLWFTLFFSGVVSSGLKAQLPAHLEVLTTKAETLLGVKELDKAAEAYQELRDSIEARGDFYTYLTVGIQQVLSFQKAGHTATTNFAQPLINQLIIKVEQSKEEGLDTLRALAYHKQGVLFYVLNDFKKAIHWLEKAVQLRQQFFSENHLDIVKGYHNIGDCYQLLGDYESAQQFLQRSLKLHLSNTNIEEFLIAKTYKVLGNTYFKKGDGTEAEKYLLFALDYYEKLYKNAPWNLAPIHEDFVTFYHHQNQPDKMILYVQKGLALYERMEEKWDEDHFGIANAYHNLGTAYDLKNDLTQALPAYQKAIEINEQFPERRLSNIAQSLSNLGIVQQKQKNYTVALATLDRAILINQQLNKRVSLAGNYHNKAEVFFEKGAFEVALKWQHAALQQVVLEFSTQDLFQHPSIQNMIVLDPLNALKYLQGKAQAFQGLAAQANFEKNAKAAIKTYDLLFKWSVQLRWNLKADISKSELTNTLLPAFEGAIAMALSLYEKTQQQQWQHRAFEYIEQSKSTVLLEALNQSNILSSTDVSEMMLVRERKLRQQIAQLEVALFAAKEDSTLVNLRKQWVTQKQALQNLSDTLENAVPRLASYFKVAAKPDIATLRRQILKDENTALLEYFVGTQHIYIAALTAQELDILAVPKDFPLEERVTQLHRSFYTYHLSPLRSQEAYLQNVDTLVQIAHELYTRLLKPLTPTLPLPEKLIIVPHGILGYLPFDALIKQPADNPTLFKNHEYLVQDHQISYTYSAALLQLMQTQKRAVANKVFLGLAPSFQTLIAARNASTGVRSQLNSLAFNVPEVVQIQQLLGGDLLLDTAATKAQFLATAPHYQILHLATHGKANDHKGDYSFLAFTQLNDNSEQATLFARELYDLQLSADLVVLSACETGIGELQQSEGIISLARGFAYAGVRSILTTLWSISDEKTAMLMNDFYKSIKAGDSKDQALRQAKLHYISQNAHDDAHPFFWAGFIPIGQMQAVDLDRGISWWIWILILVVIVGSGWYWKKGWHSTL